MPLAERIKNTEGLVSTELAKAIEWDRIAEQSIPETVHRERAMEAYKFYAGDQDSDEVKALLARQKRPASVYNEIKPKIDMLVGIAGQSRYDTTTVPASVEDDALAELINFTLIHFRRKITLGDKELDCFEHSIKSGRALLYFYIDSTNPFVAEIKAKRIPTYNFKVDPNSREYDISDAKYLIIDNWADVDEIKSRWRHFDPEMFGTSNAFTDADRPAYFNEARNLYKLSECWYYKYEDAVYFINPLNGKVENLLPEEFKNFVQLLQDGFENERGELIKTEPPEGQLSVRKVPYYIIFCGDVELEKGRSPYRWRGFPAALYGAYKDEDNNSWISVTESMKDSQISLNTMRRQLSHLLQVLPKGILAQEAGTILNIEEYESRSADPTFWLEVAKGGLEKFKFIQQPMISPIYGQLDEVFREGMKNVSGIPDSLMGVQTSSREPGVTLRSRQETGFAVLYTLYNNLSKSRLLGGKILLSFVQQYVTLPTVVRIGGGEAAKLVEINSQINPQNEGFNDITTGEFDLVVDESIETNTMRAAIGQMLLDFSHNNPGTIPPDIILEYLNIPFTAKEKVKAFHAQQSELEQANIEADREIEIMKINATKNREVKKES